MSDDVTISGYEAFKPLGSVKMSATLLDTASSHTLSFPAGCTGAQFALMSAEDGAVRITFDASTATTTYGHLIAAGDEKLVTSALAKVRVIAQATGSSLMITYFNDSATR